MVKNCEKRNKKLQERNAVHFGRNGNRKKCINNWNLFLFLMLFPLFVCVVFQSTIVQCSIVHMKRKYLNLVVIYCSNNYSLLFQLLLHFGVHGRDPKWVVWAEMWASLSKSNTQSSWTKNKMNSFRCKQTNFYVFSFLLPFVDGKVCVFVYEFFAFIHPFIQTVFFFVWIRFFPSIFHFNAVFTIFFNALCAT